MIQHLLKEFRQANVLLQKDVADKLGISREHYAQIESGKFEPSFKLLSAISKRLGVDITINMSQGGYTLLYKIVKN